MRYVYAIVFPLWVGIVLLYSGYHGMVKTKSDVDKARNLFYEYKLSNDVVRNKIDNMLRSIANTMQNDTIPMSHDVIRQALITQAVLLLMGEVVNMGELTAQMYYVASIVSWKSGTDMVGLKTQLTSLSVYSRETVDYVERLRKQFITDKVYGGYVSEIRDHISALKGRWPYLSEEAVTRDGGSMAHLKNEYVEFGKLSLETMSFFRSMADFFDPSRGNYSMSDDVSLYCLAIFLHTRHLAVRTVNAMVVVEGYGAARYHKNFHELDRVAKDSLLWLKTYMPDFAVWDQQFQQLGASSQVPAILQAASEYQEQYRKWRTALEAALATDIHILPQGAPN